MHFHVPDTTKNNLLRCNKWKMLKRKSSFVCESLANLLLELIHGLRDALLPRLPVLLLHGPSQVLLQLLVQLADGQRELQRPREEERRPSPPIDKNSSWSNIFLFPPLQHSTAPGQHKAKRIKR